MSMSEPKQRWRRRKEERPGEILAAALSCFAEHGFAATRLDEVAARAGVTKGTLYLYFPSKEELFKSVVRQEIVAQIVAAEATVAAASTEPAALLLQRILSGFCGMIVSAPAGAIPKLVIAEAGNFPELARFYLDEVAGRGKTLFMNLLRRGIESGEFRAGIDIEHAVPCVIGPVLMATLWNQSLGRYAEKRLDAEALCRTHLDLLLQGLLKKRKEPE
jgi:AcrR family transcriptional regulator